MCIVLFFSVFPLSFVNFMMQLPIEQRSAVGAKRLSSSATLFIPRWCSTAQPTVSMPSPWSPADEGSSNLMRFFPENTVNLYSQSMPDTVATQATDSTRTSSLYTEQNQSEVEMGQEENRDTAIRGWVHTQGVAAGLRDKELHSSRARTWPVSASGVDGGLPLEGPPPLATYGDRTPSFYDSPRCWSDDSMVFPATPDVCFEEPDFHGLKDRDLPMAESSVSLASVDSSGQSGQPAQAPAISTPTPSPSLVLVQVPVQLQPGANNQSGHELLSASVEMLSQEMDATTGAVALEMRVMLNQAGTSPEGPSLHRLQRHSATSAVLPQARSSPGAIAADKRDLVCCHWKARGLCKYEDSCKFMHPKEKRGVDKQTADGCAAFGNSRRRSRR